jgi:ferredoxin
MTGGNEKTLEEIREEAEGKACPVLRMKYFVEEFIDGPMCSKCYPCALGTAEAKLRLMSLTQRDTACEADRKVLQKIAEKMVEASFCKKGKDTGRFLIETITGAADEIRQHHAGVCPAKECVSFLSYVIRPDQCIMCGDCLRVCRHNAILGEKKDLYRSGYLPFEIREKRCTRCGECVHVCPAGAIEISTALTREIAGNK